MVTKDEAREAFTSVQESFASVGTEQGKMKQGLQGLASKIDKVQGKAAEDVTALVYCCSWRGSGCTLRLYIVYWLLTCLYLSCNGRPLGAQDLHCLKITKS